MLNNLFLFSSETNLLNRALGFKPKSVFMCHRLLNPKIISLFHQAQIRVNAEVGIFAGEDLWQEFPESRPVLRNREVINAEDWYCGVTPTCHKVRQKKLKEIKETIEEFDVDGIWLDFIRWPTRWEVPDPDLLDVGFDQESLKQFEKEFSTYSSKAFSDLSRVPKDQSWSNWKCSVITSFVKEVRALIDQSGKDITLGLFAVPWQEEDFEGSIMTVIGQDFKALSQYVDVFSPMTYHAMCGKDASWIHDTVRYFNQMTGKPILPLIQTENKPQEITPEEFKESIQAANQEPSSGFVVFFLEDLLTQPQKLKIIS